jgi:hypothetical protein
MAEIHLECPNCRSNIVAKMQSEVYTERKRVSIIPQLHPSFDKIIVKLKDGTDREITDFNELRALFLAVGNRQKPTKQPAEKVTPQSFDKIVVHNKDGTTREVTRFDELVLVFTELETRKETIEGYSNERLNEEIERITKHVQHRKEHHPENLRGWRGLARTLFLEKHLWLLTEEREKRKQ